MIGVVTSVWKQYEVMVKQVEHEIRGMISELIDAEIVKIRSEGFAGQLMKSKPLPYILVNLRNHRELPPPQELINRYVVATISTLPETEHDIVFGTIRLVGVLERISLVTGSGHNKSRRPSPLESFMRNWTNAENPPSQFGTLASITLLINDERFSEQTQVELRMRSQGGAIYLPTCNVLKRFGLPRYFDTMIHTVSLRHSGALCVVGQDDQHKDFVLWINIEHPEAQLHPKRLSSS